MSECLYLHSKLYRGRLKVLQAGTHWRSCLILFLFPLLEHFLTPELAFVLSFTILSFPAVSIADYTREAMTSLSINKFPETVITHHHHLWGLKQHRLIFWILKLRSFRSLEHHVLVSSKCVNHHFCLCQLLVAPGASCLVETKLSLPVGLGFPPFWRWLG